MEPIRNRTGLIRVAFDLPREPENPDWPPSSAETMWAALVGPFRGVLQNVPFYAKGIAYNDTVEFAVAIDSDVVEFVRVVAHSGHSTYRILILTDQASAFEEWWPKLGALGCTYERADEALVGIDMSPAVNVHKAYRVLEHGEKVGIWGFEEGYYYQPDEMER